MSIVDTRYNKDLDTPKNVRLFGTSLSGHIIPLETDLSGQLTLTLTGDTIGVTSGRVDVLSGQIHITSALVAIQSGEVHVLSGQVVATLDYITSFSSIINVVPVYNLSGIVTSAILDCGQFTDLSMRCVTSGANVTFNVYTSPDNVLYDNVAYAAVNLNSNNIKTNPLVPGIGYIKVTATNNDSGATAVVVCTIFGRNM